MECRRCGKCCFEAFYRHVRPADVAGWEARGRLDLVEVAKEEDKRRECLNPELAALGMALHTCRYLRPEGAGRFKCAIYEVRPITCREFGVGCSRLCPEYAGKKRERG